MGRLIDIETDRKSYFRTFFVCELHDILFLT